MINTMNKNEFKKICLTELKKEKKKIKIEFWLYPPPPIIVLLLTVTIIEEEFNNLSMVTIERGANSLGMGIPTPATQRAAL